MLIPVRKCFRTEKYCILMSVGEMFVLGLIKIMLYFIVNLTLFCD